MASKGWMWDSLADGTRDGEVRKRLPMDSVLTSDTDRPCCPSSVATETLRVCNCFRARL